MAPRRRKRGGGARRTNILLGIVVSVCVLAAVGVFALWGWFKLYLHGDEFRVMAGEKTSALFKGQGEFEEIHWTGSSAYSEGFSARGYADAPFSSIDANGIRARIDFGAARDGVWKIEEVDVNLVNLVAKAGRRLEGTFLQWKDVETDASREGFPGSLLPDAVEVGEIEIAEVNLVADSPSESGTGEIVAGGVRTKLRPLEGSGAWSLSGRGGSLSIPGMPGLEIDSFVTRLRGGELFVTDAAFTFHDDARLTASGEIDFAGGGEVDLDLKFADLDAEKILGPGWKEKVSGLLHGDVAIGRKKGAKTRREGTIRATKGVIEGLEVLDRVADYAKAERFRRLVLHEASADFEEVDGRVEIRDLVLQSDGLTRLTGTMTIADGQVVGDFRIGVTPGTLKWIPGAEKKVFVEPADGFLWTHMRVTGPVANPNEDLSARLKMAAVQTIAEDTVNSVLEVVPGVGTDSAGRAIETGKTILDSATGIFKEAPKVITEEGKKALEVLTPFLK